MDFCLQFTGKDMVLDKGGMKYEGDCLPNRLGLPSCTIKCQALNKENLARRYSDRFRETFQTSMFIGVRPTQ